MVVNMPRILVDVFWGYSKDCRAERESVTGYLARHFSIKSKLHRL